MMKMFKPNLGIVELCITYRCNVKCHNCSNLCTQAPKTDGDLSLEAVQKFLQDCIDNDFRFGMITIHGGEPALHPQWKEIAQALLEYREKYNPKMTLWWLTNNSTPAIRERCEIIKGLGIPLGISTKIGSNKNENGSPIPYIPVNESPTDLQEVYSLGCFQSENCGICYNYLGFFECSPAAAAARVFGYEPMAKSVKELSLELLQSGFPKHCMHCGFAFPDRRRVIEQTTTETWRKALNAYNGEEPIEVKGNLTISLSMIVGPNDAAELDRCLSSFDVKKVFDEVVIVTTTLEQAVWDVAKKYADKIDYYEWSTPRYPFGDFGGARNHSLRLTSGDYVMWLDADDVLTGDVEKQFRNLRNLLNDYDKDLLVIPYILAEDEKGNPKAMLMRERIFKRASGIRWRYAVHEQLTVDLGRHTHAEVKGIKVVHRPAKIAAVGTNRNLAILENEYLANGPAHPHYQYYFARDLISSGNRKAAISILIDYLNTADVADPNIFNACRELADYFLYANEKGMYDHIRKDCLKQAIKFSNLAEQFGASYAEPKVFLGDIFKVGDNLAKAEKYYKSALYTKYGTGGMQYASFYEEIPANRLMDLYAENNRLEESLFYAKVAIERRPENEHAKELRKNIITELAKELVCQ